MSVLRASGSLSARVGLVMAGVAVIGALLGRASAQTIPVVVGAGSSSSVGQEFDVPVVVDMTARTELLGSFAMTLRWDPVVLEFVNGQDGTFGQLIANLDSVSTGMLRFSGVNPAGVGGISTVGIVRFRTLTTDSTTFGLTVAEMYAANTFADLSADVVVFVNQYCTGGRYGDVDQDGAVDSRDALIALMAGVGLDVAAYDLNLADVDADGDADPRDALIILSYAVGLDVSQFRVATVIPGGGACQPSGNTVYAMTPGDVTLLLGQEVQYVVTATDSTGIPLAVADASWTSSNPSAAIVDSVGRVTAIAPGSADITAFQDTSLAGSAAVTVVASRSTHWVDALAAVAVNQTGSQSLPYGDVASALQSAGPGDTIRILPGRYEENIGVTQPLTLLGDTTGGGTPPLIAATGPFTTGITISAVGTGRVELNNLRLDTLYIGVQVVSADTLLVRDTEFHALGSNSFASIYSDSIGALIVERSRFFGDGTSFGHNAIYLHNGAGLVRVDSSLITDYGDYAIDLFNVDSLHLDGNIIRDNYGYGVYGWTTDSTRAMAVALSGNRFGNNGFGQIYLSVARSAAFDHNVFAGTTGGGIYLDGFIQTTISFLGDSISSREQDWVWVNGFDSLTVDSVAVHQQNFGGGYLYQGRVVVARNSSFTGFPNFEAAIDFDGSLVTGATMLLRNLSFVGSDSSVCNRCMYGALWTDVAVDADSLSGTNLYTMLRQLSGSLDARNLDLTHASAGVRSRFCGGPVRVSNFTGYDVETGVETEACSGQDSVFVDNMHVSRGIFGVRSAGIATTVTNSSFTDYQYGIYHNDSTLAVTDNQFVRPQYYGVWADLNGYGGTISILRNYLACDAYGAANTTGIVAYDGAALVAQDTVLGCQVGIDTYYHVAGAPVVQEIRENVVAAPGYVNAWGILSQGGNELGRVVGNTVTGPAPRGAIVVGSGGGFPSPRMVVDSNLIDGATRVGIQGQNADTLLIRDNTIQNMGAPTCCLSGARGGGAIVLTHSSPANDSAEVRRNRITDVKTHGIVLARDFDDSVVVVVDSNTVKRADSVGIWVDEYSSALVRYNAIDSAMHDAVQTSRYNSTGTVGTVTLNFNNFTHSGRWGVRNTVTWEWIDATSNWWNDVNGPSGQYGDSTFTSVGDSVSNFVTWSPFLNAPANTPAPVAPGGGPAALVTVASMALGAPAPSDATRVALVEDTRQESVLLAPRMVTERQRWPRVLPPTRAPWLDDALERQREEERVHQSRLAQHRAHLSERAALLEELEARPRPPAPRGRPGGGER